MNAGDGHSVRAALPVVYGNDRLEMGRSEAAAAGPRIRSISRWLARRARRHPDGLDSLLAEVRRTLRHATTGSRLELEGIARALSMHPHDVLCAKLAAQSTALPGCTNFGTVGPATADGNPLVSWNFDVSPVFRLFMGSFPLFVRHLKGTTPYVCFGVPALYGIGILNASGLTSVVNAMSLTDEGDGISPFELNNTAMESCASVDEAEQVFRAGPRKVLRALSAGVLMNWNTIWADGSGALSVFEYTHRDFHREDAGEDGVIASANHHQFMDPALSTCPGPDVVDWLHGSYSRLARMWALLRQWKGRIDPVVAKTIVSDHVPDYSTLGGYGIERQWWQEKLDDSTICAHNWNWKRHLLAGELSLAYEEASVSWTVFSLQIQPSDMTVWLTDGHPCRNRAVPVYFGEALGNDAPPLQGALVPALAGRERSQETMWGLFRTGMSPLEAAITRVWMGYVAGTERVMARRLAREGRLPA